MTISEKSMGQPKPENPAHTLTMLDAKWRDHKSDPTIPDDFYGVVCETIGTDPEAYRRLTEEMIAERARQRRRDKIDKEIALDVLRDFKRNFKFLSNNRLLKNDQERMSRVLASKEVWLGVVEAMRQEWETK